MSRQHTTIATYTLLAPAAGATFLLPETLTVPASLGSDAPDTLELNGLIRDFPKSHPDFDVTSSTSLGHHAGNVNSWLAGDRRPVFVYSGYRVDSQWKNLDGKNIAPILAGRRGRAARETLGFRVHGSIDLDQDTSIDAFNSNYGPYGIMGNYGADARLTTNSVAPKSIKIGNKAIIRGDVFVGPDGAADKIVTGKGIITGVVATLDELDEMPTIDLPTDLDSLEPVMEIVGPVTLTGDTTPDDDKDEPAVHVGTFRMKSGSVLTVEGDLRIVVDNGVTIDRAQITLLPEANLSFFVAGGAVVIKNESLVNVDPGDTTLVSFNVVGNGTLSFEKKSHVYATVVAPDREMHVKSEAHFYGGFLGDSVHLHKRSAIHVDRGNAKTGPANFALSAREKIEIENSVLDSFDSNEGPYGAGNKGAVALISVNETKDGKIKLKNTTLKGDVLVGPSGNPSKVIDLSSSTIEGMIGNLTSPVAIPVVAPPSVGTNMHNVDYKNGVFTLSTDLRCKHLRIEQATLRIDGDVVIRCDDKVELKNNAKIELMPNSTLIMYVKKDLKLDNQCQINMNTGNPQLVSIRRTSVGKKGKVELDKRSEVCAWIQGAKTELKVEDQSKFYGSFAGQKVKISKSEMHVDMAYLTTCLPINDTHGTKGSNGSGGITSRDSFKEWWSNKLGMNQAVGHTIVLHRGLDGAYRYSSNEFHPIDDKLLGNEGAEHNNFFTYVVAAEFEYVKCAQQFVEFRGGDGAWLFLNGQLVMDLGGTANKDTSQFVALDRLGLEEGMNYDFRLYYAQRRTGQAAFDLRTNLDLSSRRFVPSVTAVFD